MNDCSSKTIQSMCFFIFAFIVQLTPCVHATSFSGLGDGGGFPGPTISSDGSVVVGVDNDGKAYRWTMETGMKGLGSLPGNSIWSTASDVSSDGSVVVGYSDNKAFRWTAGTALGLGGTGTGLFASRYFCLGV